MRQVHDCLVFGFLGDVLEDEIQRTRSTSPLVTVRPRFLFGNPLADGEIPKELSTRLDSIALGVFFEGLDWELPARKEGRRRLADTLSEQQIPMIWLATEDIPGSEDRAQSLKDFFRAVALSMCERAASFERS